MYVRKRGEKKRRNNRARRGRYELRGKSGFVRLCPVGKSGFVSKLSGQSSSSNGQKSRIKHRCSTKEQVSRHVPQTTQRGSARQSGCINKSSPMSSRQRHKRTRWTSYSSIPTTSRCRFGTTATLPSTRARRSRRGGSASRRRRRRRLSTSRRRANPGHCRSGAAGES